MDSQYGCGLSCTVLSLLSETSYLIGRHSAVQLRAWAWFFSFFSGIFLGCLNFFFILDFIGSNAWNLHTMQAWKNGSLLPSSQDPFFLACIVYWNKYPKSFLTAQKTIFYEFFCLSCLQNLYWYKHLSLPGCTDHYQKFKN